ncbi:penicillin acylase family protein [Texcoconibacillus texcoconensis]|uniref:Penicillin amidase n=1 Tax=Texcoconibacillus texcoconensis TaxID=1095777 RepID=A0A840QMG4_9BACI|nr:penicillin acylase family protein [Texcoconibacillus texcoconensis]MBB5172531.1 penicillin amidase [Texcoconibacillus texcoconensis]
MSSPVVTKEKRVSLLQKKWQKWLFVIFAILLIIIVMFMGVVYWFVTSSHPELEGELYDDVIREEVSVIRDGHGVPQIDANSAHDAFYVQGYVTAQDRLFQMDMTRRLASGELAEVVGEDALDSDRFFRTYGMHRETQALVEQFDRETAEMVNAYAEGVTAYIEEVFANGNDPIEFSILGYEPEPWTPQDTALVVKYMGYTLSGNYKDELKHYEMVRHMGEDALKLFPNYNEERFPVVTSLENNDDINIPEEQLKQEKDVDNVHPSYEQSEKLVENDTVDDHMEMDHRHIGEIPFSSEDFRELRAYAPSPYNGSNNWAVSGQLTESGFPLIADDPHLGLAIPSVWYQTHLNIENDFESVGVTVPGIPGVVLGHNQHVAWGVTSLSADQEDLFLERVHPKDPNMYLYDDHWERATVIEEEIQIEEEDDPHIERVEVTRNGPVINKVVDDGPYQAISLRWTGAEAGEELNGILRLNRSTDIYEFKEGLEGFVTPALSWVFADQQGNIGYRGQALLPVRQQSTGQLPKPGWDPDYQWDGFIPSESMPQEINPEEGYIMTANNQPIDEAYPFEIGRSFHPYRAKRLENVFEAARSKEEPMTVNDMKEMQVDFYSAKAETLLPKLLDALAVSDQKAVNDQHEGDEEKFDPLGEVEQEVYSLLEEWDYVEHADSSEALIWNLWYQTFADALFEDIFGFSYSNSNTIHDVITKASEHEEHVLFSFLEDEWHQSFPDFARKTFSEAVDEAVELQGENPRSWEWGEFHSMTVEHPLGEVFPLNHIFNVGDWPLGGSAATPGMMGYDQESGNITTAAGWRFVGHFSNDPEFYDILMPGQSGQLWSPHYDDQVEPWIEGELKPMSGSRSERESLKELRFLPER